MTALPSRADITDAAATKAVMKPRFGDLRDFVAQLVGAQAPPELTIAAGVVTPSAGLHRLDTEADTAADDLDQLAQTNLPDGSLVLLVPENAGRVVTLRHLNGTGTPGTAGEMILTNDENFALANAYSWILLRRKGTQWIELMRSTVTGRRLSGATDAAAARTVLGLGAVALLAKVASIPDEFALAGDISPAQITSNQNDYNPSGLATASVLRLSSDASRNITSLAGGSDGRLILIANVGGQDIVLKNDDGASGTAANRFALNADLTVKSKQLALLYYDAASSRWRALFGGGAAAAGTAGAHEIWISAAEMIGRTTNGPALTVRELATNKHMVMGLAFNASTEQYAQFERVLPKSWNEGTLTAVFYWDSPNGGAGDVIWGIHAVAMSNDDAQDVAFGTAQEVTDTFLTNGDVHESPATAAMTVAGSPAAGDLVRFQVYRKAAAAGDTYTQLANLLGVKLVITTDAETDS